MPETCFVIMPFGTKPIPGSSERGYDFDKVYRVLFCRAIRDAGLEPIRADEELGSHMIHAQMFKHLRDRSVVLADLSLSNPNVFYELGVRHVMAASGTVLTCQAGVDLPFDISLSRAITYEYDGVSLDWEETERVTRRLTAALTEARDRLPDSPVHALLERVWPEASRPLDDLRADQGADLDRYQRVVAGGWEREGRTIDDLLAETEASSFGSRAIGHLLLTRPSSDDEVRAVATRLHHLGEFDLCAELYDRLGDARDVVDLTKHADAVSEAGDDLAATDRALKLLDEARSLVPLPIDGQVLDPDKRRSAFRVEFKTSGMLEWRHRQSGEDSDLERAVAAARAADEHGTALVEADEPVELGRVAQTRLRRVLMSRRLGQPIDRSDALVRSILDLLPDGRDEGGYLRWYQAIALAELGSEEAMRRASLHAYAEDARLGVPVRQYTLLRRFLDQHAESFRYPALIGQLSQLLQTKQAPRVTTDGADQTRS
jgi:hypothetical protein